MLSPAAEGSNALRTFGALTAAEISAGLKQLQLFGIPENRLLALGRVGLDGEWALALRTPTTRRLEHPDHPWLDAHSMTYGYEWHTLPSAAAVLLTAGNGDEEMERRLRLQAEETERERQSQIAYRARQVQAEQDRAAAQLLEEEERRRFDGPGWDRLSPTAQAFYLLALQFEDENQPGLAKSVRDVAARIGIGPAEAPVAFPRRAWRP